MKIPFAIIILTLSMLLTNVSYAQSSASSSNQAEEYKGWTGRFWVGVAGRYVLNDNDTFMDPTFGTIVTKVKGSSFTFGADVEYRISKLFGVDIALGYTSFELEFDHSEGPGVQNDKLGTMPLLLALNFHIINHKKLDLWLGPQLGYIFFLNDVSFDVPTLGTYAIETSSDFSPVGFNVGADLAITEDLAINIIFRWQNADASDQILVDPTLITVGISKKF